MKRQIAAGLALSFSVLGTSCGIAESGFSSEQPIEVSGLPQTLPSDVSAQIPSAVEVTVDKRSEVEYGSGVRIEPNLFLSAGHLIKDDQNHYFRGWNTCGNLSVSMKSNVQDGFLYTSVNQVVFTHGSTINATKSVGSEANDTYSSIPDVALIKAPTNASIPSFKRLELSKKAAHIGEVLFSVNYQLTPDGQNRNPDQHNLGDLGEIEKGYDQPAIFADVVVQIQGNGDLLGVTGLESYGHIKDSMGTYGESGGEDFNRRGQLVGISIETVDEPETAKKMESQDGFDLKGVNPEQKLSISVIQPVSNSLIRSLKARLLRQPSCQFSKSTYWTY